MIRPLLLVCATLLGGCAATGFEDTPTRAQISDSTLPPMKVFATPRPIPPGRSNANIADDFLSLHFALEGGSKLSVFTRFETPITVKVTGKPPASLGPDLDRLLRRLQSEAGINIRQIDSGTANVTIQAVSRAQIRRALPAAACFVVPNVSDIDDFRRARRQSKTNWSLLETRESLGIFLPYDASPQEIRDCLHEELAQALGPLNDLYRLPDSVYNDDNVHTILTGFDMLILRATYAPELQSGMTRAQVAARLPAILSRLNPRGDRLPYKAVSPTPRSWIQAVQTALGPGATAAARRAAANSAALTAEQLGWQDHRRAFSLYMVGRMVQTYDPVLAQRHFQAALRFLDATPGTDLQRAYVITQTAAYAIVAGDGAGALRQIRPSLAVAARAENGALLATLMLLQAEALELTGQSEKARAVRLDSLGWARYGFGSDWAVRSKMKEISALNRNRRKNG